MPVSFVSDSEFWTWKFNGEGAHVVLNTDAVIRNTMENMRRLEEEATLRAVVDFLRDRGYTVVEPEGDE